MSEKTILCAIDFSESSLQALKWALGLAQLTRAKIIILFCYRLITTGDSEESLELRKKMEDEARKKFNEIEKRLIVGHSVSYEFVTEVGFFPFRIEAFLRKSPVELLIVGNSIVQSFNEFKALNLERFFTDSKVPVVVVPEQTQQGRSQNLMEFPMLKEVSLGKS